MSDRPEQINEQLAFKDISHPEHFERMHKAIGQLKVVDMAVSFMNLESEDNKIDLGRGESLQVYSNAVGLERYDIVPRQGRTGDLLVVSADQGTYSLVHAPHTGRIDVDDPDYPVAKSYSVQELLDGKDQAKLFMASFIRSAARARGYAQRSIEAHRRHYYDPI